MGIQQENIIATMKYRNGKIGACYTKRHNIKLKSPQQFIFHKTTFSRLWQRLNQTGSAQERSRSGRPHTTTPAQDRYIGVFHLRNRTVTAAITATGISCIHRISDKRRYFSRTMADSI